MAEMRVEKDGENYHYTLVKCDEHDKFKLTLFTNDTIQFNGKLPLWRKISIRTLPLQDSPTNNDIMVPNFYKSDPANYELNKSACYSYAEYVYVRLAEYFVFVPVMMCNCKYEILSSGSIQYYSTIPITTNSNSSAITNFYGSNVPYELYGNAIAPLIVNTTGGNRYTLINTTECKCSFPHVIEMEW